MGKNILTNYAPSEVDNAIHFYCEDENFYCGDDLTDEDYNVNGF